MFAEAKFRYPCFQRGSSVPATEATIASEAAAAVGLRRTSPEPRAAATAFGDRSAAAGSPWSAVRVAAAADRGTGFVDWPSAAASQPSLAGWPTAAASAIVASAAY